MAGRREWNHPEDQLLRKADGVLSDSHAVHLWCSGSHLTILIAYRKAKAFNREAREGIAKLAEKSVFMFSCSKPPEISLVFFASLAAFFASFAVKSSSSERVAAAR